jgi:hypothetical protein
MEPLTVEEFTTQLRDGLKLFTHVPDFVNEAFVAFLSAAYKLGDDAPLWPPGKPARWNLVVYAIFVDELNARSWGSSPMPR